MNANFDAPKNPASGQSLVQSLLSNPAALSALLSLIKPKAGAAPVSAPAAAEAQPMGAGLGQLLANPEFLQQLPVIMSAVMPLLGQQAPPPPADNGSAAYEVGGQAAPAEDDGAVMAGNYNPIQSRGGYLAPPPPPPSPFHPHPHHPIPPAAVDKRTALLLALKPFIGEERRAAVDYIIKITELTEMFRRHDYT